MGARDRERREYEIEDASRRIAEHSTGNRQYLTLPEGLKLFNASKPGVYNIDVIPYRVTDRGKQFRKNYARVGKLYFERTFFTHRQIGVNNETFTCPAQTFGRRCPICDYRQTRGNSPKVEDVEAVKALRPSDRQVFLVYDRDNTRNGLMLWDIAYTLFGEKLDNKTRNAPERKKAAYLAHYDPYDGFTLRVVGTEKKMPKGPPITEFGVDEFMERESPVPDDVLWHPYCLDTVVRELSFDELKKVFTGTDDLNDEPERRGRDELPSRNGESRDRDDRGGRDESRGGSAWDRTVGDERRSDFGRDRDDRGRPTREADDRGREGDRGDDRRPEPARDEPARDDRGGGRPANTYRPRVDDPVRFQYRDEEIEGEVTAVDDERRVADVRVAGYDRPKRVDYEDLHFLDRAPRRHDRDEDRRPEPSRDDRGGGRNDRDEPPAKGKGREEDRPAADKPKSRAAGWDDDADKSREAKKEEPEPPAKKGRK